MLVALWSFGSIGPRGWRRERSFALSASFQLADLFLADSVPFVGGMVHDTELWAYFSEIGMSTVLTASLLKFSPETARRPNG